MEVKEQDMKRKAGPEGPPVEPARDRWLQAPFMMDAADRLRPRRVLEIGVGRGLGGMILREALDMSQGRMARVTWRARIEGTDPAPEAPKEILAQYYDTIHPAGVAEALEAAGREGYDLLVLNVAVLEGREHELAGVIATCLKAAPYLLLVLTQFELESQVARHYFSSVQNQAKCTEAIDRGAGGRFCASALISNADPSGVIQAMNAAAAPAEQPMWAKFHGELELILEKIEQLRFELVYIKHHPAYMITKRIVHSALWPILRWLHNRNVGLISIKALADRHEASQGNEAWLLAARHAATSPAIPWDFMETPKGGWFRKTIENGPYQQCFVATGQGTIRFPLNSEDPVLEFMTHPWSGKVEVAFRGRRQVVDLYSTQGGRVLVYPARGELNYVENRPVPTEAIDKVSGNGHGGPVVMKPDQFTSEEQAWIEEIKSRQPAVLAIHTPRWLGVTHSTRTLFADCYPCPTSPEVEPYNLHETEIQHHAEMLARSGVRHFVCSGGDELHFRLMQEVRKRRSNIRVDLLWHGNYTQFSQDYTWRLIQMWVEANKEGRVHTIGVVKKGMELFFRDLGCRARFVMNYMPEIPKAAATPEPGGPHVGIWSSGENNFKTPYVMLAALKMIPGAVLHGAGFRARASEIINYFNLPSDSVSQHQIPREELLGEIAKTHLSLYITFTECCPMLPLESFSVGVPCLIGPASHLFEDNEYLRRKLIVPYPDRADVIAEYIRGALKEREALVREYIRYAPTYNTRARRTVDDFLKN